MSFLFFIVRISISLEPFRETKRKISFAEFIDSNQNLILVFIGILLMIIVSSIISCICIYCQRRKVTPQERERLITSNSRFSNGRSQYFADAPRFTPQIYAAAQSPSQQMQQPYQPIIIQPYFPTQPSAYSQIPQSKQNSHIAPQTQSPHQQQPIIAQLIPAPNGQPQFYYQSFAPIQTANIQQQQQFQQSVTEPDQQTEIESEDVPESD